MAFKRVDALLDQVQRVLRGLEESGFSRDDVLDALTTAQQNACIEGHALRGQTELTVLAGVDRYPVGGLIAITGLFRPRRWCEELAVIENDTVWADIITREFSGGYPLYVRPYAETVQFYSAPTVSGEKVSLDYAHLPKAARLEPGADPEVSPLWDAALKVGALSELLGGGHAANFARAVALAASRHANTVKGVPTRDHWSRNLGF